MYRHINEYSRLILKLKIKQKLIMGKFNEIQEEVKQSYGSNSFTTTVKEDTVEFDSAKDSFTFKDEVNVPSLKVNGQEVSGANSNWNANEGEVGYIENRPFYEETVTPETIALFDSEMVSYDSFYIIKGSIILDNSAYFGILLPNNVDQQTIYGVQQTIELTNGTDTYVLTYTPTMNSAGALNTPSGFMGGGAWLTGYEMPGEFQGTCDILLSFSCGGYDGFQIRQYAQTMPKVNHRIDTQFLPIGLGGIKENNDIILDADLTTNYFNFPDGKKLISGNKYKVTFESPWTPKYDIVGYATAYYNAGQIQINIPGFSGAYIAYMSSNPTYSGFIGNWTGHYKIEEISSIETIDESLIPSSIARSYQLGGVQFKIDGNTLKVSLNDGSTWKTVSIS